MRATTLVLVVLCAAPGWASAAPHVLRPDQGGTYAAGGRFTVPDAVRIVISGERVEVIEKGSRRVLFIESFCSMNCQIDPPTDPRVGFSASLVRRPEDRGKISDPFDDTSLSINADSRPGIVTLTNGAPGTYQGRSLSALRHLYDQPFTQCSR
ncbi:hypothetical protein [Methylobacterium trifolii]|uniref:Uncharacterized protein n=1 Tax=Methylobacterium trifolii TaxID=1003092 RepID=A0ABQ4U4A7_9HYPH|nr:hypothetical protein [Methylobacterium trifolii]GJE61662.1 hypothetical protein MPOCJGCO_3785 [Methylobacterium trifolii]